MADPAPALDFPLHPHLMLLARRRRDPVRPADRRRLKRGVFPSVVALQEAINGLVAAHNRDPKPFIWRTDPETIIAAAKRGYQALIRSTSRHRKRGLGCRSRWRD